MESQTTFRSNGNRAEAVGYLYDLRGRLKQATNTPYDINDNAGTPVVTQYAYDPSGNRVGRTNGSTATSYLIDPMNPTGYSQVLQETTGSNTTVYILGGDVIGQAVGSTPEYLLYDGHGSVRNHAAVNGSLIWFDIPNQAYNPGQPSNDTKVLSYDAWGQISNGLSGNGLYFSGEMFDPTLKMYNLRARWYNPANGRFNATDPYAGSPYDPLSLHRYLYCNADPINRSDPSGLFSLNEINVVQAIQNKLKQVWNSKSIKFLRRGVDPTRQRWKMWLIQSKGMPVHFGLWLEALNNTGEETEIGPYFEVNPTPEGFHRLLSGNVFRYLKIVPGNLRVTVKAGFQISTEATGKWKICSFTHAQFGLWTTVAVGASYAEDLNVPVQFNLFFIPGTLNCTKWVAEAITLALPISILPI